MTPLQFLFLTMLFLIALFQFLLWREKRGENRRLDNITNLNSLQLKANTEAVLLLQQHSDVLKNRSKELVQTAEQVKQVAESIASSPPSGIFGQSDLGGNHV